MPFFQPVALLFSALLLCHVSQARTFYLGAQAGATDASGPFTPKEVALSGGGRLGWLFYDSIRVGGLLQYYRTVQNTEQNSYLSTLAEISYFPLRSPLDTHALYGSLFFGTTKQETSNPAGMRGHTDTTAGLAAGYMVKISDNLNLGPEYQHFFGFGDDSYRYWSVMMTLTWWL